MTYEEAQEVVRERFERGWAHGTFCLDDRVIVENEEFYVFSIGAREFIIDGDDSYAIVGGVPIAYKKGGQIGSRPSVGIATDPSIRSRPDLIRLYSSDPWPDGSGFIQRRRCDWGSRSSG
ncbi:hypothetical protein [Actinomadura miaoliensis]|uniref:hypothetical protein n=1 Tax=Actinomadura miaoliensis TaxID=430685 RepID=UPI0031EB2934